ncbi:MAG: XdhC family protein [Gammaproteobacteria bacterium]
MSNSQLSHSNTSTAHLLVLGCGEMARQLVKLAEQMDYTITVSATQLDQFPWPTRVKLVHHHFNDEPWSLPASTHAVIARAHEEDVQSVVNLLNHDAEHVYLVASAARAQSVINEALPSLNDKQLLDRLSAPAGIELGGNSSADIALSLLAEIQWRCHGGYKSLQPLNNLRHSRLNKSASGQRNQSCPGKRP